MYPDDQLRAAVITFEITTHQKEFPDLTMSYKVVAAEAAAYSGEFVLAGEEIRVAMGECLRPHGYAV